MLGSTIELGVDLLFFDEIQECPNAIMSLRYFYVQLPNQHIIAAASLLEFSLQDISFPVGRVQLLDMYPMNFYEFLLATRKANVAKLISGNISLQSDIIDTMIKDELHKCFYIGGMPECVKIYSETNSFIQSVRCSNKFN